jgi:hypothetical protein
MSSPIDLDEARRAKELAEQLDAASAEPPDAEVGLALRAALAVRLDAGGDLREESKAAIAARLAGGARRRVAWVAIPAAAVLALAIGGLSVSVGGHRRQANDVGAPSPHGSPVAGDKTVAATREMALRLVAAQLTSSEAERAEDSLAGASEDYRAVLLAQAEGGR